MADSKHLPPLKSSGVFFASGSSTIDAPLEAVWRILLDFPSYKEWNPFVRDSVLTDKAGNPLGDQSLAEGKFMLISPVHLPPTMGEPTLFQKQSAFVEVVTVDPNNYHLDWVSIIGSPFFLRAERWQSLSADANGKTKYESIEVFSGILAYVVRYFMRDKLNQGFEAMAQGLKKRAEEAK